MGVTKIISQIIIVACEMFSRYIINGKITHTDLATKLGKNLSHLVKRIDINKKNLLIGLIKL